MMTVDTFQRSDSGALFEVVSETEETVTLRAYDEAHTVSTVSRAEFTAHFDPTVRALSLDEVTVDGAGGPRWERATYSASVAASCWTPLP